MNNGHTYGPSPEANLFIALAAAPFLMMVRPWLRGIQMTRDVLLATALLTFAVYVVRSFRLFVSLDGVRYRSPFSRPLVIPWPTITKVRTGAKPLGRLTYPPYFMEIYTSAGQPMLTINIKFFSREALACLAANICQRASQADIDSSTRHLAKGDGAFR